VAVEVTPEALEEFFGVVLPHLNEVQRRVVAGAGAVRMEVALLNYTKPGAGTVDCNN